MYLSFASSRVDPRGTHGYTGGMVQYCISFFSATEGKGSCLALKTTSLDHGDIPMGLVRGSATGKVIYLLPRSMCYDEEKVCKKNGYICLLFFANEK